jgi:chromosome partitioning protein
MKTIAIANQKGGTAKTTTAAALAVLLARGGTPTHLVDMDPQASLTRAFGLTDEHDGLYHALTNRAGLPVCRVSENLTLTPSTIELGRAEGELLGETGREFFLRTSLEKTRLHDNAIVLLDCPPSLGVLAVNCLSTAGGMIAVIQPGGHGRWHDRRHTARWLRAVRLGSPAHHHGSHP